MGVDKKIEFRCNETGIKPPRVTSEGAWEIYSPWGRSIEPRGVLHMTMSIDLKCADGYMCLVAPSQNMIDEGITPTMQVMRDGPVIMSLYNVYERTILIVRGDPIAEIYLVKKETP